MSITHWIRQPAANTPDKPAIHFGAGTLSYAALERQIRQTEQLLTETLGLQAGERIAWYGLNHPDMLILLLAAARCRLILVPLNWRLAPAELLGILHDCAPRALFHDGHFREQAAALLPAACASDAIPAISPFSSGGVLRLAASCTAGQSSPGSSDAQGNALSDPPLMIVYTSGTTGQPKGAVLTQASFACNARMSVHMHDMTAEDHVLAFLPMFHVGGFNIQTLPALSLGATVTVLEKFDPSLVLQTLHAETITLAVVVPTILQALLAQADWATADLCSLRALAIGSTDVPVPLIERVHARGIPVLQVYGTTETSPLAIYQRIANAMTTVGSIGQCGSECQIRLVNEQGQDAAPGENGEIWVRGENILAAYWQNPAATAQALVDGIWFRSGDVAHCDADGFYWFADRLKHVIISGGENIYAAELERVIRDWPGLVEMAVVGRPDEKWGEVAVVVAVRADNANLSDTALRMQILDAFTGKIARFKHPRDVLFVEALPRTALGKVQVDAVKRLITTRYPQGSGGQHEPALPHQP